MTRSKGQSIVEFAFIAPMLVFMLISIIYVGIAFLDYTQYSNAARDAARDISLQMTFPDKKTIVDNINKSDPNQLKRYATTITDLLSAKWSAEFLDKNGKSTTKQTDAVDVHITIDITRTDLPPALERMNILPKNFKAIDYKMRLENNK